MATRMLRQPNCAPPASPQSSPVLGERPGASPVLGARMPQGVSHSGEAVAEAVVSAMRATRNSRVCQLTSSPPTAFRQITGIPVSVPRQNTGAAMRTGKAVYGNQSGQPQSGSTKKSPTSSPNQEYREEFAS